MKLQDVVTLVDPSTAEIPNQRELRAAFDQDLAAVNRLAARYQYDREWARTAVQPIFADWNRRRGEFLQMHGWLPDEILGAITRVEEGYEVSSTLDDLGRKSLMPRVDLGSARELAEKAGMLIFPLRYLREEARAEERATRDAIGAIEKALTDCEHYVVAPLSCLDLHKFAKDDKFPPMFKPTRLEAAFEVIEIQLPMFRMVLGNREAIAELDARTRDNQGLAQGALQAVKDLSARVDRLQVDLDRRAEEQARVFAAQQAEQAALAARLAEMEARAFRLEEPLLLSIPKTCEQGPLGSGQAYVGPCWGPDMDEIVLAARGLTDTGARAAIEESLQRWTPISRY